MNLARLLGGIVLIASSCTSMWAQTASPTPAPVVPNPFQFIGSQYKGLLPGWPVILQPGSKPCAVARIMKPNPAIDPGMIPHNAGPAPMPIEAHSRDITELNVPAPSCMDPAPPQVLNPGPEKR